MLSFTVLLGQTWSELQELEEEMAIWPLSSGDVLEQGTAQGAQMQLAFRVKIDTLAYMGDREVLFATQKLMICVL